MSGYLRERGITYPENSNKGRLLVVGNFSPGELVVNHSDSEWQPGSEDLRQKIENLWAPKAEKGWFAGPLVRLIKFGLRESGELKLTTEATNFKDYTGSRDMDSFKKFGFSEVANPISTSSVLGTADEKMIIGLKLSGDATGSIDAVGGYVNPIVDVNPNTGAIDLYMTAVREVMEETGLIREEIFDPLCLGLSYEFKDLCHPVVSFAMRTSLEASKVLERKGEELNILVVDTQIGSSDDRFNMVLGKYHPNVEPDGRITMALARRWFLGRRIPKKILLTQEQI